LAAAKDSNAQVDVQSTNDPSSIDQDKFEAEGFASYLGPYLIAVTASFVATGCICEICSVRLLKASDFMEYNSFLTVHCTSSLIVLVLFTIKLDRALTGDLGNLGS
jgi:hypothetical protein